MNYDYDLFVIGAGSGGVRAARIASQAGARVAIAEEYRIGGTCVIRGCVPKKFLVYGAEFAQAFADAAGYGWTVAGATFDWATLRDNVQKEVTRLSGIYNSNLIKAGVTPFEERAELVGANRVKLLKSGSELSAERILIATGGAPQLPDDRAGLAAPSGLLLKAPADLDNQLRLQGLVRLPQLPVVDAIDDLPEILRALLEPARAEMPLVDETHLRCQPAVHVDAVGNVADRHQMLRRGGKERPPHAA